MDRYQLLQRDTTRLGALDGRVRRYLNNHELTWCDFCLALQAVCESGATEVHISVNFKYDRSQAEQNFAKALAECQPPLPLCTLSCFDPVPGAPEKIVEYGKGGTFPQLKHLALMWVGLSDKGARDIVDWLQQPAQSLQSIDLGGNDGVGHLEGAECFIPKLCSVLADSRCHLTDLNLQNCSVSLKNGVSLVRSLRQNDTLQLLDLSGSCLADALADGKEVQSALEALRYGLHRNCSLRELWIGSECFNPDYDYTYPGVHQAVQIIAQQCLSVRYVSIAQGIEPGLEDGLIQRALSESTAAPRTHPFLWSGAVTEFDQGGTHGVAISDPITAMWQEGIFLPPPGTEPGHVQHINLVYRAGHRGSPDHLLGEEVTMWDRRAGADACASGMGALKLCLWRLRVATRDLIAPFIEGEAGGDGNEGDGDEVSCAAQAAKVRSALLECTEFIEACAALGDALTTDHILMLSVLTDVIIECQEPSRVPFKLGDIGDATRCQGSFFQLRHADAWELDPERSVVPHVGARLSQALTGVLLLAERNGLECAAKLRKRWVKLMCLRGLGRRDAMVRWRRAVRAHADAPLVHRAAREGRPMELAKRLLFGRLAGGLHCRLEVAGTDGESVLATPLEAAMAGGHAECVRILQEADFAAQPQLPGSPIAAAAAGDQAAVPVVPG